MNTSIMMNIQHAIVMHGYKVAIGIKKSIQVKILHQKVVPCHCQSLQQRFREDCPCLIIIIIIILDLAIII